MLNDKINVSLHRITVDCTDYIAREWGVECVDVWSGMCHICSEVKLGKQK